MLDKKKLTGPNAGSMKYDILTALGAMGLAGNPTLQTSVYRLTVLITARYNWRLDEVSVGQRDLAKLWSVNERTVKREMKRLSEARIIVQVRAGVRGRVGAYRLNYSEILRQSRPVWENVGPDFQERMGEHIPESSVKVVKVDFERKVIPPEIAPEGPTKWRHALQYLKAKEPELYKNWFAGLVLKKVEGTCSTISAPSSFVARYIETHYKRFVFEAVQQIHPEIEEVQICVEG